MARRRAQLVCQHLENVSGRLIEDYPDIFRDFVRGRHGIYALYRRARLYYVGLATNLRQRLNQHLRDRHGGKWDEFSLYLTIGDRHLREIESLLLRTSKPRGNVLTTAFARSENLRFSLRRRIREQQAVDLDTIVPRAVGKSPKPRAKALDAKTRPIGRQPALAKYVTSPFPISFRYQRGRCTSPASAEMVPFAPAAKSTARPRWLLRLSLRRG